MTGNRALLSAYYINVTDRCSKGGASCSHLFLICLYLKISISGTSLLCCPGLRNEIMRASRLFFFQGDEGHEMYIIKSGALKIYQEHEYKQIILAHQFPGETLGELEVLHHDNRRLASAATIEKNDVMDDKKASARGDHLCFSANHAQIVLCDQ